MENGLLSCADPKRLQQIADGLTAKKIQALWKKWEARLPQPFSDTDRRAGYGYELFLQQVEFSRTQVFDRPLSGRLFFEQMLRDNLDLGRPHKLQLIFDKRIPRTTKTQFRTRLITEHVIPSLWRDDKSSSIKQYFKEERALRTELTVNNTRDFGIGKALKNLAALRQVAFAANRRLLHVQQLSHDLKPGLMTYHLRRLRLRGLIARIPKTHRYQLTDTGHRAARFDITSLSKVIRPAASELDDSQSLRYFFRRITQSLPVAKT